GARRDLRTAHAAAQRHQRALPRRAADRPGGGDRGGGRLAGRRVRGRAPRRPRRQARRARPGGLRLTPGAGPGDHEGDLRITMPWPTERDHEVFDAIEREVDRQNTGLQLIASENFTSPAVMDAVGSVLTNKYSEGYPTKRFYGGNQVVDQIEDLARQRVCELFGAEAANVQPHSGANANLGVYLALLEAGDTVLGLSLDHGGHLTHGSPVNISGRFYDFVSYGLTPSDERLDLDQLRDLARTHRPKMIVAGATAYPRIIDPAPIREICDEVGAL